MNETKRTTIIKILNDTDETLTVRLPPTAHKLEPRKTCAVFIEGDEVFFKIWNDNVVMFTKSVGEVSRREVKKR